MIKAFIVVLLACSALTKSLDKLHPLSDEFIKTINSKQNGWIAGRNFDENTSMSDIKKLLGSLKSDNDLPVKSFSDYKAIPESFDSATQWPECEGVINTVVDQSACGSCWAVAAASAMSDRRCIQSKGKLTVPVSAEDLLSCCSSCGFGCNGGYPEVAWRYWNRNGIVTGGLYNSSQGCRSYSLFPCEHHTTGVRPQCSDYDFATPHCKKQCDSRSLQYNSELTHGQSPYTLRSVEDIQREILENGPVEASFDVYEDFLLYKSGVYRHTVGSMIGGHAVRIVGWGEENGTPYWNIANSWNTDWGNKGYFKIIRGKNEGGIESNINAGLAKL